MAPVDGWISSQTRTDAASAYTPSVYLLSESVAAPEWPPSTKQEQHSHEIDTSNLISC